MSLGFKTIYRNDISKNKIWFWYVSDCQKRFKNIAHSLPQIIWIMNNYTFYFSQRYIEYWEGSFLKKNISLKKWMVSMKYNFKKK